MADSFEEEAEPTVSIQEYLKEVEDQELEADLVLGGDEGKECTYNKGYMKRQALFSCLTCTPDGNAGVCTACSLSCHDGHEIVELWTKRSFRCDCGNSKFGEFFCKIFPGKDVENEKNAYNQNFKGAYCTCGRPYPDPEAEEQVEMIQCCVCEDWFHEEHIGLQSSDEIPRDEEGEPLYEDFICPGCSVVCSFLTLYPQCVLAATKQPDASSASPTNMTKGKDVMEDTSSASSEKVDKNAGPSQTVSVEKCVLTGESSSEKINSNGSSIQGAASSTTCALSVDLSVNQPLLEKGKPLFLAKSWREVICRCEKCTNFYAQKAIGFLADKEDSIVEYEKIAKQKRDEKLQEEEGNFLNGLGHVEKMEILTGIADMKSEIHSFLESYDPSKPITSADVHQVFENLAKKRRRMP